MDKKSFIRVKPGTKLSATSENLKSAAAMDKEKLFAYFSTSESGLADEDAIKEQRDRYGENKFDTKRGHPVLKRFFAAFVSPFTVILLVIAIVSFIMDIALKPNNERNYVTFIIILTTVIFSGILHFVQETKSSNAVEKLTSMVETTATVLRGGVKSEIPIDELVVGDLIYLGAGDIIPCDGRIIDVKDLFITQSALTGESEAVEKIATTNVLDNKTITDIQNLVFMGTTVISGSARMIAIEVGKKTILGEVAKTLTVKAPPTSFEKGIRSLSWILIYFMLAMVPIVLIVNGLTKNQWLEAFLFAITIAVGLTPEMLPMIVTACLSKGAAAMAKKKVIIKKLDSIQNFGAMDILCTDKTGTITQDQVVLEQHLDVHGNEDVRVLRHAFLNAYYQTGLKNIIDLSIINKTNELASSNNELVNLGTDFQKIDEVPFDFNRRRMSVVVKNGEGKMQMITKGAVEEIISVCSFAEYNGKVEPLTGELKKEIFDNVAAYNRNGMRVIAVAQKTNPSPIGVFSTADENDMVLLGYLTFLDPAKPSAKKAISDLMEYGVKIKILTGDNDTVTQRICQDVGLDVKSIMLGSQVEALNDEQLKEKIDDIVIFAKLLPDQKARVIRLLKKNHVVGYMGDGINDAQALREADIGISVDTAVDIAKESADVILLENDLGVLKEGIIEGRKVYNNILKYIKITTSSNFGNMLSVLVASIIIPFLPMLPVQLILLNMIYDISCAAIPWDNVDPEYLSKPRRWEMRNIVQFIFVFGPVSSIFDIITFVMLFFVFGPMLFGASYFSLSPEQQIAFAMFFQTGWFIESMWSQSIVIHVLRTQHIAFIQSRAAIIVFFCTFMAIGLSSILPFLPGVSSAFQFFGAIPPLYFLYTAGVIVLYVVLASVIKYLYIKKNQPFL